MTEIMEIYERERVRLERELLMVKDLNATVDCVCASLERMRLEYSRPIENRQRWSEVNRLFDVSRQSVKCMLAVSGAEVKVVRNEQSTQTVQDKLIAIMPMAAMVVGAILTVWLMLEEMNGATILTVVLTAIAWLETQVVYRRQVAIAARGKADHHELLRLMDRLMEAIEDALEQSSLQAAQKQVGLNEGQPTLTGEVLEPVQMLLEAVQTGDGEYALKAVPALTAALMGQGIEAVNYSAGYEEYFDLYPGTEAGITIRPALLKDGRVLARGQATEEMK